MNLTTSNATTPAVTENAPLYYGILTDLGQAMLAEAIANATPLVLTQMSVGDGGGQPVTPQPEMTALVNEVHRAPLNQLFVDPTAPDQIVAEMVMPETVGGFWIRELGLHDEQGQLIAIANTPDSLKPLLEEGAGRALLTRMILIVSDTSAVELIINPDTVMASRAYVDAKIAEHAASRDHPAATQQLAGMSRFATQAEAIAGLLDNVAVAPKEMQAAMESLLDIVAPIGVPIPWVAATPPNSRFLIAQGQSFDKVAYPKLGALWPTGVIPFDMRGEFPRGWDNGRGVDVGRTLLSTQLSANLSHTHTDKYAFARRASDPGGVAVSTSAYAKTYYESAADAGSGTLKGSTDGTWGGASNGLDSFQSGGSEARPRNIAFNYIVRAA